MSRRSQRLVTAAFTASWIAGLAWAFRLGVRSFGLNPEQLLALVLIAYLATWGLVFFRSRRGPVVDAALFLLCTASLSGSVAVFELPAIFQWVDYRVLFATPTPPWKRTGHRPDPDLLYVREGHRRVRRAFQGNELGRFRDAVPWKLYRCDVRYDRDGFRNPQDRATSDVIVLGDSFIEGLHVDDENLVTTRLAAACGRTVANLGRTGDGPQQQLHLLRRYGLARGPGTCIWAFYEGNDLGDAARYEASREHAARAAREPWSARIYGGSFTRNALSYVIRTWIHPERRVAAYPYAGRFAGGSGPPVPVYFGEDVRREEAATELSVESSPAVQAYRRILQQAHALCRERGIDLVVVFIPTKFRVYRDLCTFPPESPCPGWPRDDLPDDLRRLARGVSEEIGYLDLTPLLRDEASRGALVYLPDDTHWSAEGHRVAAMEIANRLLRRPGPGLIGRQTAATSR